jgi:4-hydroxyphenylpyruvate dioxygenase-like putative hemolysin
VDTTKVAQVAIIVRDVDAKAKAWSELLGIEPSKVLVTGPLETTGTEYKGEKTPARLKVAVFDIGGFELEIMEPIDGPSVWRDFLDEHGEGLHHIGLEATGIDGAIASIEAQGMPLVQRAEYKTAYDTGRNAYFASEEKLGAMIELNELL